MGETHGKGTGSVMVLAIVVFLLSIAGAGAGFTVGTLIGGKAESDTVEKSPPQEGTAAVDGAPDWKHAAVKDGASAGKVEAEPDEERIDPLTLKVTRFPPVLTTLAEPKGKWIRIEGAILTASGSELPPELLAERAGEQILAYLRTLSLNQIEGPSGFLGLKDDLTETVRVLSGGEVKGILIHGLVVE